jgi:tetratricopeptide (TPR) repeat protein
MVALLLGVLSRRRAPAPSPEPATWAQADSDAERALLAGGSRPHATERLGRYYLEAGRPFEAVWQFQEALAAAAPGDERNAITLLLAQALQQGHWYGPAARVLQPLMSAAPGNRGVREQLAELYLTTGRSPEAVRLLRGRADLTLLLGRACQAAGDGVAAREAYERATRERPDDAEPLLRLGRLLLAADEPAPGESAIALFRRAILLSPSDPRPLVALGRALMERGGRKNLEEAGRRFTEALALAPSDVPAQLQLGVFHQREGRRREAGHAFLAVLKADPDHAEAHRRLGDLMAAMGEQTQAHYHRGWAFVFQDRPQDAVSEFKAMLAADPKSIEAPLLISQGYTEMVQDQDDRAVAVVKHALAAHPQDPRLKGRLAALYFLTHDRRAAAELCAAWRRFQPEEAEPIWMLGKLAVADHQLDEGIRLLAKAASKEPARADFAFELGEALARRPSPKNLRRALDALGRAVSLEPGRARYRYQLAVVLERLRELEGARRQLLRVLDQDPRSVPAANSLVRVAQALGRSAQARFWAAIAPEIEREARDEADLRRRLGRNPNDAEAEVVLARLLIRRGALAKAREHLARARELRPNSALFRAAWAEADRTLAVVEE